MNLIGITGAIGHGKSTLAEAFVSMEPKSLHLEAYKIVAEVADALHQKLDRLPPAGDYEAVNQWLDELPAILKQAVNAETKPGIIIVDPKDIAADPMAYQKLFQHLDNLAADKDLLRHKINDANKSSYRPILQWLGGFLVAKISPTIWFDEMIRRAQTAENKGTQLVILGGVRFPTDADVIHGAGGKVLEIKRPGTGEADLLDPTERDRQKIQTDATVVNNGTIADLQQCTKQVLNDLKAEKLKAEYLARASS